MAFPNTERRLSYQEAMELITLPQAHGCYRYMSRHAAWLPGEDLPGMQTFVGPEKQLRVHDAAFGGHVYAQSVWAICHMLEAAISLPGASAAKRSSGPGNSTSQSFLNPSLGLHTIHGYFTAKGQSDRPFVYETSVISRGRSFVTARVDVRQPLQPPLSKSPGPGKAATAPATTEPFSPADAAHGGLGIVCFTAIVSFVQPRPHSLGVDCHERPVQERFSGLLTSRVPSLWDPSPSVDMDILQALLGRQDSAGTFPIVDMKKVDMATYNNDRPLHEQRNLILYRLLAPLPTSADTSKALTENGNAHVLVHAYAADRNGLLMAGNHLDFAVHKHVASLSNTFVVHTNVEAAVMAFHDGADAGNALCHWWVQEVCFPRAGASRSVILNKIWSPAGIHVASEYQDGLCLGDEDAGRFSDVQARL